MKASSITRRFSLSFLTALLIFCKILHLPANCADRLNLIAICTDDQARWAMSAYGNKEVQTPNMDRIAAEGALFLNAFCNTPVCSPSRATYLTGRYSTELGITDYINTKEAKSGLGLKNSTWPQALKNAGYATAMIGKWHLGEKKEFHPTRLGFDYFMGCLNGGTRPMNPTLEINGVIKTLEVSLPDFLVDDAMRWIGEQQSTDKAFSLNLHFRAPHGPYLPVPPEDSAHYKGLDPKNIPNLKNLNVEHTKKQHRDYYSSISSVDRNIGRLLDFLDTNNLTRNTVVLFTSDHGYNLGRHYISTKGNGIWLAGGPTPGAPGRPNMWDTSVRVPLAIRWPGVVKPGALIKQAVSFVDFYKTMLGILDVRLPENLTLRGNDFSPLLRGKTTPDPEYVFAQYDHHNVGLAYLRMIRSHQYKLVRHFHSNSKDEFYDLENDPGELKNLFRKADKDPKLKSVIDQMNSDLQQWMKSIDDPLLKDAY